MKVVSSYLILKFYMELTANYPFKLHWVWGHQSKIPPVNLSTQRKNEVFFASGSVGVCYNWPKNQQNLLLGHKNDITCIAVSSDKIFLVSVDSGTENALIIWQTETRAIFHVISDYFGPEGVLSMCFSSNDNELITLSGRNPQQLSIWDWKNKKICPDFIYVYRENAEYQHFIAFHSSFSSHFASCGSMTVYFFEKNQDEVKSALLNIKSLYDNKVTSKIGNFTQTAFCSTSSLAVTATTKGMIILWGRPLYSKRKPAQDSAEWFVMSPEQRVCIRMIQVMESKCSISFLSVVDNYIIAGTERSEVIYYDEDFNIKWCKELNKGHIKGVSFSSRSKTEFRGAVQKLQGKQTESHDSSFEPKDFIISTEEGYAGFYAASFKQLKQILWGTNHLIKSIAVHPLWNYFYFGDYNGDLQKWNYVSKELLNNDLYESSCSEIELIAVDNKGAYIACVMSNGNLVIFDAICFSSKPCFAADEVLHKPTMIHFSPDSQHLLIIDVSSYVTHYRVQLLVVPKVYQMMQKDKVPPEEPLWSYGGKSRQHQGQIIDSMFKVTKKNETLFFFTLGEDRFLVQYNISNSKGLEIDVSKRIVLERKPVPTCMAWCPLYDVSSLIAILSDDYKMRIYSVDTEKIVRTVSLPLYEEPIKRIFFRSKFKHLLEKEFPGCTNIKDVFQYFIFNCSHMIGLSKFPIDGNPNTSLGVTSTPSGINIVVTNKDQTFLFTTGLNDSWVFMYEISIMALLKAEEEGGEGIEAFKYLFPSDYNPDEMKNKLIYSVYALELEMKMLKFGSEEQPVLNGEVPVSFLHYVLAALGCFITHSDLQLMLTDIEFENKYLYDGKKTTLNCLDIMKLYVNYRPSEPVTKNKLKDTFYDVLSFEEDPDQMARARFIDILTTRGDCFTHKELVRVLKCLKSVENHKGRDDKDLSEDENDVEMTEDSRSREILTTHLDKEIEELRGLIPEYVTEEVLFRDIMGFETAEENLSKYSFRKEDYERVQAYPTLEDFIAAVENR